MAHSRKRKLAWSFFVLTAAGAGATMQSTGCLASFGASAAGERLARMQRSAAYRDGLFHNSVATTVMMPGRTMSVAKEWLTAKNQRPPAPLPSVALTRASFVDPPPDDVRVCWLGHSTVLLEIEGTRLLFDPVWSKRSSPSTLVGPARFQPVPLPLEEIPDLTAVVISHDHYDHLDMLAVRALAASQPTVPFFTPLGVGAHLERWGISRERIHELDWWEEASPVPGGVRLIETPSRHFSGRGPFDRNTTLWASWVVVGQTHRAFFGGDGGYDAEGFVEIGRRYGPFDLTMIEIGAYHPNWGLIHMGPENALGAHIDLGGRVLLPIHWGAFALGVHPWDEPITTLLARASPAGVRIITPRLGELTVLSRPPAPTAWWEASPGQGAPDQSGE